MIKIISINYQERSEQAVARPQSAFKNMPDVIQLDCLNDASCYDEIPTGYNYIKYVCEIKFPADAESINNST